MRTNLILKMRSKVFLGVTVVCFTLAVFPSPAQALYLVRQPYLQSQTYDSVTIVWRTWYHKERRDPGVNIVRYSEDKSFKYSVEAQENFRVTTDETGNGWQHEAAITGLKPDTIYHYQVITNGEVFLQNGTFRTASTSNKFTFLVLGDSGKGDREEDGQWGVARRIKEYVGSCEIAIGLGDHAQSEGQAHDYQRFFFDYYQDWLRSIPFFPIRGNHEYDWVVDPVSGYRTINYDLSFVTPNANPRKVYDYGRPLNYGEPEEYYKIDYGNAVFLALCIPSGSYTSESHELRILDMIKEGSPQHDWMVKELKEARRRIDSGKKDWLFVYFHVGPYSYWGHGSVPEIEKELVLYFEKYGVDVVFSGHTHDYERTVPMKVRKQVPEGKGVVYVTSGGAGPDFYPRRNRGHETFLEKELLACFDECHHFVIVDINGKKLRLRAIRWDGKIVDTYERSK